MSGQRDAEFVPSVPFNLAAPDVVRTTDLRAEPCRVASLVEEAATTVTRRRPEVPIELDLDVAPDLVVALDRVWIRRALVHVVRNAVEAMPAGGVLSIVALLTARGLEIEVADSGDGFSDVVRHRAFQPSYTTKPHRAGHGLTEVAQILAAHGGEATLANCPQGGGAVTLLIRRRVGAAKAA